MREKSWASPYRTTASSGESLKKIHPQSFCYIKKKATALLFSGTDVWAAGTV